MKVEAISNTNSKTPAFKGFWSNKIVLKSLETVADHSASFLAGTNFVMTSALRPLAISVTPNIKEENKRYAVTNSIASGGVKFALVAAVAIPIENAIKKIEKDPEQFLKQSTIDKFTKTTKSISNSKDFKFLTQFIKQSIGFLTAIPKSIITVALIPILMTKLFSANEESSKKSKLVFARDSSDDETQRCLLSMQETTYKFNNNRYTPSFKGIFTNTTAKGIAWIFDSKYIQSLTSKFKTYDTDITRDMTIATDLLLTASFTHQTIKNKNIEQERKKPLIVNNILGSAITIFGGYSIDELIKNNTKNFKEKFIELNKNNPKLSKYIEGINIVRPTLIFAAIYYGLLPIITTYIADKTDDTYKQHTS